MLPRRQKDLEKLTKSFEKGPFRIRLDEYKFYDIKSALNINEYTLNNYNKYDLCKFEIDGDKELDFISYIYKDNTYTGYIIVGSFYTGDLGIRKESEELW